MDKGSLCTSIPPVAEAMHTRMNESQLKRDGARDRFCNEAAAENMCIHLLQSNAGRRDADADGGFVGSRREQPGN